MLCNESHGHTKGGKWSKTYRAWKNMIIRCTYKSSKDYKNYAGRGISICRRWMKFENFLEDMGVAPIDKELDRKNNDGNYTPKNCRWVSRKTQMSNTRRNVFISSKNERLTISEWAMKLGVNSQALSARHKLGWDDERVVNETIGRWKWDKRKIFVEISGEKIGLKELSAKSKIKYSTVFARYKKGWAAKDLVVKPYSLIKRPKSAAI